MRAPRHALAICVAAVLFTGLVGSPASANAGVVSVRTVTVDQPQNPAVAVVPFTDAIYETCADAPESSKGCLAVGAVDDRFDIGELEITVDQWVTFLNTVDPTGRNSRRFYAPTESAVNWPKFGQVNRVNRARKGRHYRLGYPEWADKPYGFANFLEAARFVNSLQNGRLLSKRASSDGSFDYVTYKVRLSKTTERGMYNLARHKRTGAKRSSKRGFVVPSQDEWVKAAYFDPAGGGTYSYWKYPTNEGTFGDGQADGPNVAELDSATGDVTNAATQPLSIMRAAGEAPPSWCPLAVQPQSDCDSLNPFGIDPTTYAEIYQGSLGTVGQAHTRSPWGTLDQGGNAVEWTDTITPSPAGNTDGRVWRRLHGGIANSTAYQLWISAVGLQPQNNKFFELTYPWLGFRVGVIGNLKPARI